MAPDTTRTESEDTPQMLQRCRVGLNDLAAWIKTAKEDRTSLQRELAEARALLREAAMYIGIDVTSQLVKERVLEFVHRAPGPSDAKGETLTPLTDPSVRGVLVDDGVATNKLEPHRLYVDDGGACFWPQEPVTYNVRRLWHPVRLCPASEFGRDMTVMGWCNTFFTAGPLRNAATAGAHFALGDRDIAEQIGLAARKEESDDYERLKNSAKPTPAEPAQKLVPLPEGARVIVRAKHGESHWVADAGGTRWRIIDPTLYGVPAERVAELESEVARLEIMGHEAEGRLQRSRSGAERLRKAIETADAHYKGGFSLCHVMAQLRAALTPPTAASGEAECPCDIERGCAKGDGVRVEGKCTLELKSAARLAAESGGNTIPTRVSAPWVIEDEAAESRVGGHPLTDLGWITQKAAEEAQAGCDISAGASAPAAESGPEILNGRLPDGAAATCRSCGRLSQVFVDDKCPDCHESAAPAVESEDVEYVHRLKRDDDFIGQAALVLGVHKPDGTYRGLRILSAVNALSARLAACEERCKELEAGIERALVPLRELNDPDPSVTPDVFEPQEILESLLAPKAEGGKVQ